MSALQTTPTPVLITVPRQIIDASSLTLVGSAAASAGGLVTATGTDSHGQSISGVYYNNLVIGETIAAADGTFHLSVQNLTEGENTVVVSAPGSLPTSVAVLDVGDTVSSTVSSVDVAAALASGGVMNFLGTESVQLLDGTLSVGADTMEATIERLYLGLLGRRADPVSLASADKQTYEFVPPSLAPLGFGYGRLTTTYSPIDIASTILGSQEYQAKHAGLSDQQYVNTLYQGLLGRSEAAPDFWTGLLAKGVSRAAVAAAVADTPEAKAHLASATANVFAPSAPRTLAQELYETGLNRSVDRNALNAVQMTYQPLTPLQLAQSITGSTEFTLLHSAQNNATYVNNLYQSGLGRAADAAGASYWGGLLAGGVSRAEVLLDIATSPEAAAHLTAPGL